MVKLKATRPFTYSTRRLLAGDVFEASKRDARLLLAIKKAEAVRPPAAVPPPPPAVAEQIAAAVAPPALAPQVDDDLLKARAEYRDVVGRAPFHAWDVATLREKIATARAGQ